MNRLSSQTIRQISAERCESRQILNENSDDGLTTGISHRRFGTIRQMIAAWINQFLELMRVLHEMFTIDKHFAEFMSEHPPEANADACEENVPVEFAMMRARARIIAEKQRDQWFAWLAETPQQSAAGGSPEEALWHLLQLSDGELECNFDKIASIDSAATDGHLEFSVPYWRLNRFPKPSAN